MEKIKDPICYIEVGERNFKGTYVSPYNNQLREFLEMVKRLGDIGILTIVLSIWHEALRIVVVESFALNVPVIWSNIGGVPEMISEGINGMLFDPYK